MEKKRSRLFQLIPGLRLFFETDNIYKKIEDLERRPEYGPDGMTRIKDGGALGNILDKQEKWKNICKDNPVSEEDIALLKAEIRSLRDEEAENFENLKKDPNNSDYLAKRDAYKNRIEELQKIYSKKDSEFKEAAVHTIDVDMAKYTKEKMEWEINYRNIMSSAWLNLIFAVIGVHFAIFIISLVVFSYSEFTAPFFYAFVFTAALFVFTLIYILKTGYTTVPEAEEWVMEWFGEFLTVWKAGLHFQFPFFLKRKGRIFTGDQKITLYLDLNEKRDKISARVDFRDASADVIVELFFRIFNSKKSQYQIDDLVSAIAEKMEAGIRAYYGNLKIDDAIKTRAEVDLRAIIIQDATGANTFKDWGVKMVSLAVTDIKLPPEVEKERMKILSAEKDLEVKKIEQKTAEANRTIQRLNGEAESERLIAMSKAFNNNPLNGANYDLSCKKFDAYKNSKVLIVGGEKDMSLGLMAATGAATAGITKNIEEVKNG